MVTDGYFRLENGARVTIEGQTPTAEAQRHAAALRRARLRSAMSAPFILRPIATTLMIVAVVLLGLLGYRLLPVAALPMSTFPTIQVVTRYPGASPDVVETSVTAPLEHYFGADLRPDQHELDQLLWHQPDHAEIRPVAQHRCGRAGRAGGDQCGRRLASGRAAAEPAGLSHGQSRPTCRC